MSGSLDSILYRAKSIHLYRHLLREAGYLPDKVARLQIRRQIRFRFRHKVIHRRKLLETASSHNGILSQTFRSSEPVATLQQRLKTGESALKRLHNANLGCTASLYKVLLYAYGRIGKRRYEMLRPILEVDDASTGVEAVKAAESRCTRNRDTKDFVLHVPIKAIFDGPKKSQDANVVEFHISRRYERLRALALSQTRSYKPATRFLRGRLRSTLFKMPKFNIWKRPMPQKRVKNMLNKWYGKLIDAILPCLPKSDWDHLRALAIGAKPFEVVERRRRPMTKPDFITSYDLEKLLALQPGNVRSLSENFKISKPEEPIIKNYRHPWTSRFPHRRDVWLESNSVIESVQQDLIGSELQTGPRIPVKRNQREQPHHFTQRMLRRMYGKILWHCSFMQKDETGKWRITWGSQVLNSKPDSDTFNPLFSLVTDGPRSSKKIDRTEVN
jgi:LYRM2-like protein